MAIIERAAGEGSRWGDSTTHGRDWDVGQRGLAVGVNRKGYCFILTHSGLDMDDDGPTGAEATDLTLDLAAKCAAWLTDQKALDLPAERS